MGNVKDSQVFLNIHVSLQCIAFSQQEDSFQYLLLGRLSENYFEVKLI